MELKHIVFFAMLLFGVPVTMAMLKDNVRMQKIAYFMMILFIPFVYSTGINFFTDEFYKGTVRGYEVLATDMIAWSLLGSFLIGKDSKDVVLLPRGSRFYLLYFIFSCISIMNAENRVYSGYVVMQMILHFIFFVTVYNAITREKNFDIILYALGGFIIFTFFHMLVQRLLWGIYQPSGVFIHRNSTAMFSNMLAPIFLSLILNKEMTKRNFYFFVSAFLCSSFVVILSLSRGAIIFLPMSLGIVILFSARNKMNSRKAKILALIGICAVVGVMRAAPMVIDRFENAPETSAQGRVAFAKAAVNMAEDKFFGVGLNNWGLKINPPYRYWEDTGIKRPYDDFKSGIVETIYLLVAAECGWIGLVSLLLWFGYYYYQNIRNIKAYWDANGFFMAIGVLGALSAVYGQSCFEWILKQQTNSYEIMIIFAIIAAMTNVRNSQTKGAK